MMYGLKCLLIDVLDHILKRIGGNRIVVKGNGLVINGSSINNIEWVSDHAVDMRVWQHVT